MTEVQVNLSELKNSISSLKKLQKGTDYMLPVTSELVNHGRGEFFERTNTTYRELMQIEKAMLEIVINTQKALANACMKFQKTDNELSKSINSVGVSASRY